jgi:hypothetical protein
MEKPNYIIQNDEKNNVTLKQQNINKKTLIYVNNIYSLFKFMLIYISKNTNKYKFSQINIKFYNLFSCLVRAHTR